MLLQTGMPCVFDIPGASAFLKGNGGGEEVGKRNWEERREGKLCSGPKVNNLKKSNSLNGKNGFNEISLGLAASVLVVHFTVGIAAHGF